MTTRKTLRIAFVLAALALSAVLFLGMKPFTSLPNSCPECPINGYEQLIFADGKTLTVHLLGDYPEFYLVERFGEFPDRFLVGCHDVPFLMSRFHTHSHSAPMVAAPRSMTNAAGDGMRMRRG